MPTKTKPKLPSATDFVVVPVRIPAGENERGITREQVFDCLDVDDVADPKRAQAAIEEVEGALTLALHMLRRAESAPLSAHLVAALEPIANAAAQLSDLLHPNNLHFAARTRSGFPLEFWWELRQRATELDLTIETLRKGGSVGAHRAAGKAALDGAMRHLEQVFDRLAPGASKEDRAEFLKLCRRRISRSAARPTKRAK